jgi:hypothetical protein
MFRSDVTLHCTLWEDYATKFINFVNGNNDGGPTILSMKYAKIKKEGNLKNHFKASVLYILVQQLIYKLVLMEYGTLLF